MLRPPRKLTAVALAAATSLVLAACGDSHTTVTVGDNTGAGGVNASYLDLGNLRYQVQISRQLNPFDPEDKSYLTALPAGTVLGPNDMWFGIFLLVQNRSKQAEVATNQFTLTDTQGNAYHPVPIGASNVYAYHPQTIASANQLPPAGSPAYMGPTQASLVLFKLPVSAYDNRPLVLTIGDPAGQNVKVTLDV